MNREKMLDGPIFKTLLIYSIPLIITNLIQLLFHAADVAVLAFMTGDAAVAAVGACGSIISLLVCLFSGFSSAAHVMISRRVGAGDVEGARRATGNALVVGLISGVALMIVALVFAKQFLILTNCQPEVLDAATLYMRIYFIGMPITMLYNFVASVLRAVGDSVRPMTYMFISGALNVGMNVIFVGAFDLEVAGVALATVIANFVSLVLSAVTLAKNKDYCRVEFKNLRLRKLETAETVKIGVPICLASIFFYIANVVVSSIINSMSTDAMTANAIANQFDGIVYNIGFSIAVATSAMVGQNFGAKKLERVSRVMKISAVYASIASLVTGAIIVLFADALLGIMTESATVADIARSRLLTLCFSYFVTSLMEVLAFSVSALGKHVYNMIVGATCGFGVRCAWAFFIVRMNNTLGFLFTCYPVSAAAAIIIYLFVYRSVMKKQSALLLECAVK